MKQKKKSAKKKISILVTGGGGFLGRELVRQLVKSGGYRIRVTDLVKSQNFSGDDYIQGDLTNSDVAEKSFRGIDYCIHLAAKSGGIGFYHKYPATIIHGNNKLYSSVFEAAVKHKIKKIIYTSSSMVYGFTELPMKEEDFGKYPTPPSAYGFSKLIGEYYCRSFLEEFGLPYTICRPFNLYGPEDLPQEEVAASHVIPDFIKKILNGQYPVEVLGSGKQTRCFTHVADAARGIILAIHPPKALNNDFNLGSDKETEILELARQIFKICFPKKEFKYFLKSGFKMDVQRHSPVINKAYQVLGWIPEKKLELELPFIVEQIRKQIKK